MVVAEWLDIGTVDQLPALGARTMPVQGGHIENGVLPTQAVLGQRDHPARRPCRHHGFRQVRR